MTHNYTLVAESPKLRFDKTFLTRSEATKKMYELVENLNLKIEKVWEDKHDITYICNDSTRFHINRYC